MQFVDYSYGVLSTWVDWMDDCAWWFGLFDCFINGNGVKWCRVVSGSIAKLRLKIRMNSIFL